MKSIITLSNDSTQNEVARMFLQTSAVSFNFETPYTFSSGLKSPMYLDNRILLAYPEARQQIISAHIELIKNVIGLTECEWISATATAALPMGAMIAQQLDIPFVYTRSSAKVHGKQQKLEGFLKKEARVLVFEDHISTAGSALDNVETIREYGSQCKSILSTSTYMQKSATEALEMARVQLYSLTTGVKIVEQAHLLGAIDEVQKNVVLDWFENPGMWYDEHYSSRT